MIRKRKKLGREWRIAAWCLALGFATQGILAMAVTPFLGSGRSAGPLNISGGAGVIETIHGDKWFAGSATIPLIEWPFPSIQIGWFPPDSWSFTDIYVAESIRSTCVCPASMKDLYKDPYEVIRVPRWSVMSRPAGRRTMTVRELATGWPWASMYGRVQYGESSDKAGQIIQDGPHFVWSVPIWFTHTFAETGTTIPVFPDAFVPLRPILLGTAANSTFFGLLHYAAIWIVFRPIWRLLTGARRRERFARGECIRCAYPLGAGNRCPECGLKQKVRGSGRVPWLLS